MGFSIEGLETTFCLWSFLIIFTEQPTNSGLKIHKDGLKDCKCFQENVSLSLANRKLARKNYWKFFHQSI